MLIFVKEMYNLAVDLNGRHRQSHLSSNQQNVVNNSPEVSNIELSDNAVEDGEDVEDISDCEDDLDECNAEDDVPVQLVADTNGQIIECDQFRDYFHRSDLLAHVNFYNFVRCFRAEKQKN